jgi:hypothetical protein
MNAFIPRQTVHEWSEDIGKNHDDHQASLARLLKHQRRLTRFIEENREQLSPATSGVAVYLTGVIIRLFDLADGRMRTATWAQIRQASAKVSSSLGALLPVDDGFSERARGADRSQPHILDEALMALFETDTTDEEVELDPNESLKVYALLWVITEVLDGNWQPKPAFSGEAEYEYVHIEPERD